MLAHHGTLCRWLGPSWSGLFVKCQSKALSLGGSHISKKIMACKSAVSVGDCCAWGGWELWGRWKKNGHWEEQEYDTDRNTGSGRNDRPCFFPVPFRSFAMWPKPAHSHYMCSEFPTAWHWARLVIFFGQRHTSRSASVPVLCWVLKRTLSLLPSGSCTGSAGVLGGTQGEQTWV